MNILVLPYTPRSIMTTTRAHHPPHAYTAHPRHGTHVAELQLHLGPIHDIKPGCHRIYKLLRSVGECVRAWMVGVGRGVDLHDFQRVVVSFAQ